MDFSGFGYPHVPPVSARVLGVLAVLAPGQGSQKPGFLTPWLALPETEARLRSWSALAKLDLVHLGTAADAEDIKDTAKTQPLLVAAAILAMKHLPMDNVAVVAGHSVGELAAAAGAGILTPESAIALAAARGHEMATACALDPTGMSAVLGGDPDEIITMIEAAGLYTANRNGSGQIVVAGAMERLENFAAHPPTKTRVIPLKVAGAFHTPFMEPAEKALNTIASTIKANDPERAIVSNLDGSVVENGPQMLERLVRQVTRPVRWDLCTQTLVSLGVEAIIELPPAGTLAGLMKRACKGIEIITINTPDDLPTAIEAIIRHAGSHNPARKEVS